ncbi:MAG: PhoH family protein [Acidobacteria bacterium]|nr:MAG: PhoH family protein [Acidobacteriota bacterium]
MSGRPAPRVSVSEEAFRAIVGERDANLRQIERTFGVRLAAREGAFVVEGEPAPAAAAATLLEQLAGLCDRGYRLRARDVALACRLAREAPGVPLDRHFVEGRIAGPGRRRVVPRTAHQRQYLELARRHDLVFAIGPAGTGKTYLAVALAAEALAEERVRRIVLCRPAVEAGERLGFLPGDLAQKINPYLRPLYDALYDILGPEKVGRMIEQGIVEIAPLAFMRGRTLNESFIILDEAQNTTPEQMKMFLTRIGEGSKAIVTGDVTQIDLPPGRQSGVIHARRIIAGVPGIAVIEFDKHDVVRHELVQRIVRAYETHEQAAAREEAARAPDPADGPDRPEGASP